MILIGKPRHGIVRLWFDPGPGQAPLGMDAENRQAGSWTVAGPDQSLDKGGNEHGLAGPRQAGHTEPQTAATDEFIEAFGRDAGFENQIGQETQWRDQVGRIGRSADFA